MPYKKEQALQFLINKIDYKKYGQKHGESRFTKFFQNYYLPKKFGQDKRRPHLSSRILSGELSRDEALKELLKSLYDPHDLNEDKSYISKKLGISVEDLDHFIHNKRSEYSDFPNWDRRYYFISKIKKIVEKGLNRRIKSYS